MKIALNVMLTLYIWWMQFVTYERVWTFTPWHMAIWQKKIWVNGEQPWEGIKCTEDKTKEQ